MPQLEKAHVQQRDPTWPKIKQIKSLKKKSGERGKPASKNTLPARLSLRFEGEIKSFTDKQKLKEFITTKSDFSKQNRKDTTRNMKMMKGKISLIKANIQ